MKIANRAGRATLVVPGSDDRGVDITDPTGVHDAG